jgi:hypothetical protein
MDLILWITMSLCETMTLAELRRHPVYRALPRRLGKSKLSRQQLCAYMAAHGAKMAPASPLRPQQRPQQPGFHWFVKGQTPNFAARLREVADAFAPISTIGSDQFWRSTASDKTVTHILVFGEASDPSSWQGMALLRNKYGCINGKCGAYAGLFHLKLLITNTTKSNKQKGASGKTFMEEVHAMARRMKCQRVTCFALPAALGFYAKLGYHISDASTGCKALFGQEPTHLAQDVFKDAAYRNLLNRAQRLGYGSLLPSKDPVNGGHKKCNTPKQCVEDGVYMSYCL